MPSPSGSSLGKGGAYFMQTALDPASLSLQHFGDNLPYALWVMSYRDFRVLYVNPEFSKVWGISPQEFIAEPMQLEQLVHPEDRVLRRNGLERQLAGEKIDLGFRILRPDGEIRWVREIAFSLLNAEEKPVRIVVLTRDISDFKHLSVAHRESEARFRLFFDNSPEAMFCTDPSGRILFRNQSSYRKNKTLKVGDGLELVFHEEDRHRLMGSLAEATSRCTRVKFEARLDPAEGSRWVAGSIAPIPSESSITELMVSLRDISTQKQDEEKLRQTNTEISVANAKLRELDALKGQFVAGLVHDIRSPLSAVVGSLDIMRILGVNEEIDEYLSIAHEGLSHALLLINEMLEVNRIEIGGHLVEKAPIEPKSCLLECLHTAEIEARRRSITISSSITMDSPPLPMLNADRVRFKRVIDNLLTNAIKFTPHDGTVSLDARVVRQTDGTESLEVTVADTGVGIAPEDQRTIFDPYVQAKNDRRHLGVGLGLAVVKHIVEAHGGSVHVESEPGRGTRFTVAYPI